VDRPDVALETAARRRGADRDGADLIDVHDGERRAKGRAAIERFAHVDAVQIQLIPREVDLTVRAHRAGRILMESRRGGNGHRWGKGGATVTGPGELDRDRPGGSLAPRETDRSVARAARFVHGEEDPVGGALARSERSHGLRKRRATVDGLVNRGAGR